MTAATGKDDLLVQTSSTSTAPDVERRSVQLQRTLGNRLITVAASTHGVPAGATAHVHLLQLHGLRLHDRADQGRPSRRKNVAADRADDQATPLAVTGPARDGPTEPAPQISACARPLGSHTVDGPFGSGRKDRGSGSTALNRPE